MAGTNAVAVKEMLLAALKVAPALAGVQVAYAWPGQDLQRERVYLGRVFGPQNYRGLGPTPKPRDELLTVKVYVEVDLVGDAGADAQHEADLRARELGGALEDAIAADPSLGSSAPGPHRAAIAVVALDGGETTDGRYAQLVYDVQFFSRLR